MLQLVISNVSLDCLLCNCRSDSLSDDFTLSHFLCALPMPTRSLDRALEPPWSLYGGSWCLCPSASKFSRTEISALELPEHWNRSFHIQENPRYPCQARGPSADGDQRFDMPDCTLLVYCPANQFVVATSLWNTSSFPFSSGTKGNSSPRITRRYPITSRTCVP
jgi:hypothetical protein